MLIWGKINDSLNEALRMSDKTVQQLVSDVGQETQTLFQVSEGLAVLDMVNFSSGLGT